MSSVSNCNNSEIQSKSKSSEAALHHLKTLKPYDGWSLDIYTSSHGKELVMLRRRNVPLYTKGGFETIVYDGESTKCIVGVTSIIGQTAKTMFGKGIVLVEKGGDVSRDQREVRVSIKQQVSVSGGGSGSGSGSGTDNARNRENELNESLQAMRRNIDSARDALRSRQTNTTAHTTSSTTYGATGPNLNLSDEQTSEMAKLGLMLIGILTLLRILSSVFFTGYVLVLPLGVMYALSTCPSEDSFDAKKELKRVLRGHHLPENHPEKPKDDWLSSTIARVTASVATELATSLGYELSFINLFGACHIVTVNVPVASKEFYWIGIFGTWRYMLSRDLPKPE